MAATFSAENPDPLSLRRAGLRVTAPRLVVLATVREGDYRIEPAGSRARL